MAPWDFYITNNNIGLKCLRKPSFSLYDLCSRNSPARLVTFSQSYLCWKKLRKKLSEAWFVRTCSCFATFSHLFCKWALLLAQKQLLKITFSLPLYIWHIVFAWNCKRSTFSWREIHLNQMHLLSERNLEYTSHNSFIPRSWTATIKLSLHSTVIKIQHSKRLPWKCSLVFPDNYEYANFGHNRTVWCDDVIDLLAPYHDNLRGEKS